MFTKTIRFISLLVQLMISSGSFSQPATDPRNFYNNIIDIGNGEYGTVVGDDALYCYFICIRNITEKNFDSTLNNIRISHNNFVSDASFIKEFYFGIYQVLLYQCRKGPRNNWQKRYFGSMSQNMLTGFSIVYIRDRDSLLVTSSEKIWMNTLLKGGQVVMSVPKNLKVKRGMPLISNNGFIAGIFAEDNDGKTSVTAINMKDIADLIYDYSNCSYFNMIEFKRHANRCVLEQMENQTKAYKGSYSPTKKSYFVNLGLFGNVVAPTTNDGVEKAGVSPLNYGASFYFNIDPENRQRITIKIGTGKYEEVDLDGFWKSSDGKFKMPQSSYKILNQSFVYERQFYRFRNFSGSVGLGYNLGITSDQVLYIRKKNAIDQSIKYKIDKTALVHRLVGEFQFLEWKILRLGAIFWKDFGKYPNSGYSFDLEGTTYKPLEARKKMFYHGFEASIRFGGIWGRKKTEE